jgi:hypothetical protein
MPTIFILLILIIVISFIISALKTPNKSTSYKRMDDDSQQMFMHQTMYNNANDLNGNGVPDNLENKGIDSDHDGIPDSIDPDTGLYDGSSNDLGGIDSTNSGADVGNNYDAGCSFDSDNSIDSNSFDSNSFESNSFDSNSIDSNSFDNSSIDSNSFDSSSFDNGSSDF